MHRFSPIVIVLLVTGLFSACDDNNKKKQNNNNNNNNNTCACGISITSVNGYAPGQIPTLIATQEDRNLDMPGFQVEVVAEVAQTGFDCVPPDGAQVTLMGGVAEQTAALQNYQVTFTDYTIPSGAGTIQLYARVPDCQSERVPVQLSTGGIPECRIESGVQSGTSYSCPEDDQAASQLGLQRVITVRCVDVPAGTPITILVDDNEQGTANLTANNTAEFAVTLPVTAICKDRVTITARVPLEDQTLTSSVTTGQACCLGVVPCSLRWNPNVDYATGAPAGLHALNMSTDADANASDHQSAFEINTRSDTTARLRIVGHNGNGNWEVLCEQNNVSTNTFSLPCTVPDGTAYIKPVCTTRNDSIDFEDASQIHHVIVDTVAPPSFENFACTVTNAHEVDITCTWEIPASGETIGDTQARYTANYDETQCVGDTGGLFANAWSTLPITPGYVFPLAPGAPGDTRQFVFSPFVPNPGYCLGIRPVDPAGNPGAVFSTAWSGEVVPQSQTLVGNINNEQFGMSITSADLNCDGLQDLVVGAPNGPCLDNPANFCYGDGRVFVYFARPGVDPYGNTPDLTLQMDPSVPNIGGGTFVYFGNYVSGIGNFTGHFDISGDSALCEDLAVGAPWMYFYDETFNLDVWPGAVYILRGRPTWDATTITTDFDDPSGFDLVIPYLRMDGIYTDNIDYFEEFGTAIAPIGDFDGDGVGDIAISAPNAMPNGAVYVYRGTPIPFKDGAQPPVIWDPIATAYFQVLGESNINASNLNDANYEWLGFSLSALGDIDRDGKDDFIIGAPGCGGSMVSYGSQSGKALLIKGGNGGIVSVADPQSRIFTVTTSTTIATTCLGYSVAGLDDFNGDGFLDVAISDMKYNIPATGPAQEGAVFVYFLNGTFVNLTTEDSSLRMRSEWPLTTIPDYFGTSVAPAVSTINTPLGDYNNDGLADLIVGSRRFGNYHGSVFVWLGSNTLLPSENWKTYEEATFWFVPPSPYGYWGNFVRWLGDINGDGYSDIGIGDYAWDGLYGGTQSNAYKGRVTILY